MELYSDNSISVVIPDDDSSGKSDFQTVSGGSSETLVDESEQTSEETSEELVSSEETSESYGEWRSDTSETFEQNSEIGSSGNETSETVELLTHIDTSVNNLYGLVVVALVLVGIGLVLRFIWGLLNK